MGNCHAGCVQSGSSRDALERRTVDRLAARGISLRHLLIIYDVAFRSCLLQGSPQTTTKDLVQSLLAKQPRGKRRYMSFLECMAADLSLPLLPPRHFVVHSWELSASDMFLGVAEFANRGGPVPSTREDVLNVSWHEEHCPQNLDATFFLSAFSVDPSCPHHVGAPDCEMDKFRQVAELIYKRCRGDLLVLLDAQAEVLNRTLVLDEINGAITADIPVHVWLEGAVPPIRIDVEKSRAHDAKLRNRIVNRIKAWHGFESFNARVQRHMEALVKAPEESNANVLEEFVRSSEVWQGRFWFALRVHGCADTDVEALPEAVGRACKDALQRTHVNIDSEILRAKSTVIMTRVTFVVDLAIARVSWLRVAVAAATGWLESQVLHNLTRRNGSAVDNNLPRGDLRVESLAVARELPAWIRNDPDGRPPSIWSGVRPHSSPTPTAQKPSITARPAMGTSPLQPPGEARSKHTNPIERERPVQMPEHIYNQGSSSSLTQLCCGTGTNIWSGTSPRVGVLGRDTAPPRTSAAASPNSRQDGLSPAESARFANVRNAEVCRSLELLTAELQRGKIISGNET